MNYAKIINIALFIVVLMASIQLSVAQELSLTYDANGNLVTGDGYYRIYNSLNQLWKVYNGSDQNGTLLEELIYHPTEERVYIKRIYNPSGNVTETVYYISQRFVRVVNQSGTYDFGYVYHNGQLVAQDNPDGTTIYIHGDHLGSNSVITNESGQVVENTTYSPFGEIIVGGNTTRYDYTGQELDSVIGDYDYHARRYRADWSIFSKPDKIISEIFNPSNLNHYSYVRNNPYRYVDLNGFETMSLGITASGGFFIGVSVGFGVVLSKDSETGEKQIGLYFSHAAGSYGGLSGSVCFDLSTNPKNNQVEDEEGESVEAGGSGEFGTSLGVSLGFPANGEHGDMAIPTTTISVGGGLGFPGELHVFRKETEVAKIKNWGGYRSVKISSAVLLEIKGESYYGNNNPEPVTISVSKGFEELMRKQGIID